MRSFETILSQFENAELAAALCIEESHARAMKARGSIPMRYWPDLLAHADRKGIDDLTAEELIRMHIAMYPAKRSTASAA